MQEDILQVRRRGIFTTHALGTAATHALIRNGMSGRIDNRTLSASSVLPGDPDAPEFGKEPEILSGAAVIS